MVGPTGGPTTKFYYLNAVKHNLKVVLMRFLYNFCCLFIFLLGCISPALARQLSLQHVQGREVLSLNGRWNYIIDPYENGYYDYRHQPFDKAAKPSGGFLLDRKQTDKRELIEYDFDLSPTLNVPGDWNSQVEKLELYEGTVWLRRKFDVQPTAGSRYLLYFAA